MRRIAPPCSLARLVCGAVALGVLACGGDGKPAGDPNASADLVPPQVDASTPLAPDGAVDGAGIADEMPLGANRRPEGGVTFRVWAPHASKAWVEGSFSPARIEMTATGAAVYEAVVPQASAGATYTFVFATEAGEVTRLDPYCRELTHDRTACRVIDPAAHVPGQSSFSRPARTAVVAYELHVGSFTPEGTFAAAQARLAELADLGVNVVELMPVHAFGGKANSWGYNPQLWLAPKETYGTADDLRAFVDRAHELGIAVWIDFVVNHADGWAKAPLRCFDGFCPNGEAGIYFFAAGPDAKTPWGPRPDYAEPRVADMFLASVEQWLVEYRGDGFRWDSVSNIRGHDGAGTVPGGRDLIVRANDLTHRLGGTSVAEDLKGWDVITKATSDGGFGFDAQWDAFGWDVNTVLTQALDDARDMGAVARTLRRTYAGDPFARLLWIENHDTVGNGGARLPVRVDHVNPTGLVARKRALLGATLLLTTPGVPMLFMGQEGLAITGFSDPPLPLPAPDVHGQQVRAFYKDAIALRRSLPGLQAAPIEVFHQNDAGKVVAYGRGDTIVVANFKNKAYARYDIGVPSAGPWHVRLASDDTKYGDDFPGGPTVTMTAVPGAKDGKPYTLTIPLGAYSSLVLTP